MPNYKNKTKIVSFAKKYDINTDSIISKELVRKARMEIGYSKNTTGIDIRNRIKRFISSN